MPVNLALTAVVAMVAATSRVSAPELGLARSSAPRGLRIGAAGALVVTATLAAAAAFPETRPLFEDQRVEGVDGGVELAYQGLVRIPLGTVVLEEFAFRGALLALLARHRSTAVAVGVSSALFGLWHIRPTLSALETNDLATDAMTRVAAVGGAVAFTALAGVVFCALRLRSGSLLAPMAVHTATNTVSLVAAYASVHRDPLFFPRLPSGPLGTDDEPRMGRPSSLAVRRPGWARPARVLDSAVDVLPAWVAPAQDPSSPGVGAGLEHRFPGAWR